MGRIRIFTNLNIFLRHGDDHIFSPFGENEVFYTI